MIEDTANLAKSKQKLALISQCLKKIEEIVEDQEEARRLSLPLKLSDYLRYIDLLVLIQRSQQKTWQVYKLEDFKPPERPQQSLDDEIFSVRHHIKSWYLPTNI